MSAGFFRMENIFYGLVFFRFMWYTMIRTNVLGGHRMYFIHDNTVSLDEKVSLMQEDAAYDVADNDKAVLPDLSFIRETTRSRHAPPKVPKVFLSNELRI